MKSGLMRVLPVRYRAEFRGDGGRPLPARPREVRDRLQAHWLQNLGGDWITYRMQQVHVHKSDLVEFLIEHEEVEDRRGRGDRHRAARRSLWVVCLRFTRRSV